MRKFKLIKNFCDSGLQEGDIITFPENSNIAEYRKTGESSFLQFTLSEIEKYTENWEEIIELDKLPEKWFVVPQTEENLKFIKQYDPSYSTYRITDINNAYRNNTTNTGLIYHTSFKSIDSEFVKITIEDFKKFVLDKKKDYEILSLKYHNILYNIVDKSQDDWKFYNNDKNHCLLSQAGKDICGLIEIYSVKRLSDGEVFTVGDDYINITAINTFGVRKIKNFNIKGNSIFINNSSTILEKWGKYKKPLFTTEDGVDIFEGDNYWVYDPKMMHIEHKIHKVNNANQTHTGNGVGRTYFSTKEAIEEYILMNKPCLSINDILDKGTNIVVDNPFGLLGVLKDDLIKLVKSKL